MYKKNGKDWFKHWDFILIDLLCMQISYIAAFMLRHGRYLPYVEDKYRVMAPVMALLGVAVAATTSNYYKILRRGYYKEFLSSFKYVCIVMAGSLAYMFMTQNSESYSRVMFTTMFGINVVLSWVLRSIHKKIVIRRITRREGHRSTVAITSLNKAEDVVRSIVDSKLEDIHLAGIVVIDKDYRPDSSILGIPIVADKNTVVSYIKSNWVDEVFINLNDSYEEMQIAGELADEFMEMGITVHTALTRGEEFTANREVEKFAGFTVLSSSIAMVTPGQMLAKRVMDILGGIVGCILMVIAFIFVAPIIFIKSPGPVIFKQERVGKNGKTFKIYKFRSMYMDAEERKKELMEQNKMSDGMMFKIDDDPRIIKGIGSFIRKYSIDELPQFWNILIGDMSLVGTRPPTVDEWEKYELHHRKRLAIKPGLTGMWQVSGRSNIVDFEKIVELDTKYIAEWNLGLDIKIILKTIMVVLRKEGSV